VNPSERSYLESSVFVDSADDQGNLVQVRRHYDLGGLLSEGHQEVAFGIDGRFEAQRVDVFGDDVANRLFLAGWSRSGNEFRQKRLRVHARTLLEAPYRLKPVSS